MTDFVAIKDSDDELPCPRAQCEKILRKTNHPVQQYPEQVSDFADIEGKTVNAVNMSPYFGHAVCPEDCPHMNEHGPFSWAYGPHAVSMTAGREDG